MMKTKILYEDKEIFVVYKPAGIATQTAGTMQMDVVSELKNYLMATGEKKQKEPYLGVIHRLDQPVEGILVFAKTPQAAAALSRQVTDRTLKKEYLAAVLLHERQTAKEAAKEAAGQQKKTVLTDYLVKDSKTNTSKVVNASDKNAKKAVLSYEIIKTVQPDLSQPSGALDMADTVGILRIQLETGRHHQIRVQLANAGMSLLGDLKYACEKAQDVSRKLEVKDVALCADKLTFQHPRTGKRTEFSISPQKPVFQKLMVCDDSISTL
jgi:23S rRNA pseudouridine1911/1915/1917 synthase